MALFPLPLPPLLKRAFALRHSWIWLLAVVGLVYGAWLNRPETGLLEDGKWLYSYDENYTVLTARRIADGDTNVWNAWRHPSDGEDRRFTMLFRKWDIGNDDSRYEWVHPPTPRMIMAGIIRRVGMNAAFYRIPSVLLGLLTVAMVWVIGCRMRGPAFGLFAAALAATDGWLFCLSRVGMTDIYFISMTIAAYAVFYVWWTATQHRALWMLLVGALCGAALAMKWSAAAPILGLGLMTATRLILDHRSGAPVRRSILGALLAFGSLAVLPLVVYSVSFWPFFAAGHSVSEWIAMHRAILDYNRTAPVTAPNSTIWYVWPLDRGVTWFLTRAKNGSCQFTYASSNWFVWMPFVPAMVYVAERFTEEPRFDRAFLVAAGAIMWLPYAAVHRFIFTRYFTLAAPFGALAIATVLFDVQERWPGPGRALRLGYLGAAIVFFVLRYPLWAGVPMDCKIEGRQWDSWLHVVR
jgi:dolichyl-phosphate-mannose--protein O-mannosyl transferase